MNIPVREFLNYKLSRLSRHILKVSTAIGLVGIIAATYSNYKSRNEDFILFDLQHQFAKAREVDDAITDLRAINQQIRIICQYSLQRIKDDFHTDKLTLELKQFNAKANLVKASLQTDYIFNQQVYNAIRNLTEWDEKNKGLCAKNTPDDSKWREQQIKIDNAMKKAIDQTKDNK